MSSVAYASSVSKSNSFREQKAEEGKIEKFQRRVRKQRSERQRMNATSRRGEEERQEEKKDDWEDTGSEGGNYETVDTQSDDMEGGDDDGDSTHSSDDVRSPQAKVSIKRSISAADELYNRFLLPSKVSRHSLVQNRDVLIPIGLKEKIFLVLDDPQCCGLAKVLSLSMMGVIVLSCVIYVISTDPSLRHVPSSCDQPVCDHDPELCPDQMVCEPVPPEVFTLIEVVCIVIFTLDYGLRALLVGFLPPRIAGVYKEREEEEALALAEKQSAEESGQGEGRPVEELLRDPPLAPPVVLWRYCTQVMNVIDVVAIVPFYIELGTSSGSSIAIVRVLRLARMLRIFKASKYNEGTKLLSHTILRSLPVLSLLFFFTALGVVLFGSLIFFMEGGKFEVTEEYPAGAYLRNNLVGVQEVTPYTSIPVACYWVVVTATTVGFGDLYPTSGGGRLVACFCMYIGLLVLALPITVVGSNFTMVYEEKQEILDEKERVLALRQEAEKAEALAAKGGDSPPSPPRKKHGAAVARALSRRRSFSESGVDGLTLELVPQTGLQLTATPSPRALTRRSNSSTGGTQTQKQLSLMQEQLALQQAHMMHLHEMQNKVQQENQQQHYAAHASALAQLKAEVLAQAPSPSQARSNSFKRLCSGKIKPPTGRVRRKSAGDVEGSDLDFTREAKPVSRSGSGTGGNNFHFSDDSRSHSLPLDVTPRAGPGSVDNNGSSSTPVLGVLSPRAAASAAVPDPIVDSRATLQLALQLRQQLDLLVVQLQRQEGVIAEQQRRLARQEEELHAVVARSSTQEQLPQQNQIQIENPPSETVYVDI